MTATMLPGWLSAADAWTVSERRGAVFVDVRAPADFASGHPKGAISLPYSQRSLAARLAVALPPQKPVIVVASGSDHEPVADAVAQLADHFVVLGALQMGAWHEAGLPEESLRDLAVEEVAEAIARGELRVLDVREPMEWETGLIPGAALVPLGRLRDRLPTLPRDSAFAVICESGVRSSTGASLLQSAGWSEVLTVSAGMSGYRRSGLPLELYDDRARTAGGPSS